MLGSARGGSECFDNGIDIVTHHFLVRVDIRAIGHQSLREHDAGIAGEACEDFVVRLLFGENRADFLFSQRFQEFGKFRGVRKLFAVEALDGISGELVVLAEIAKGIVCCGKVALFFGDAGDLLTRPTIEFLELRLIARRVFLPEIRMFRVSGGEGLGDRLRGAAKVVNRMPPMGIDAMIRVIVIVFLAVRASALQRGNRGADIDDLGPISHDAFQCWEVGFQALARNEKKRSTGCAAELFRVRLKVVRVARFANQVNHFQLRATDLVEQIREQRMKAHDLDLRGERED